MLLGNQCLASGLCLLAKRAFCLLKYLVYYKIMLYDHRNKNYYYILHAYYMSNIEYILSYLILFEADAIISHVIQIGLLTLRVASALFQST